MRQFMALLSLLALLACGNRQATPPPPPATTPPATTYAEPADTPSGDTLFSAYNDAEEIGYRNQHGDTIVPFGRYRYGFADTITTYGVVTTTSSSSDSPLVAIDTRGRVLYEVYFFDNGPDYVAEGLFRIRRNGLIGYADTSGRIVIPPQFACADPFDAGRARVAFDCQPVRDDPDEEHSIVESDSWFFIDKSGTQL